MRGSESGSEHELIACGLKTEGGREINEDRCVICGGEGVENLLHFVLDCGELEEERSLAIELQRPRMEQRWVPVGEFLFGVEDVRSKRDILARM